MNSNQTTILITDYQLQQALAYVAHLTRANLEDMLEIRAAAFDGQRLAGTATQPGEKERIIDFVGEFMWPHQHSDDRAVESRAWSTNGVEPEAVFQRMDLECSVASLHLRLQHAYGLRPREVVMLKPLTADQGKNLFVTDGTKGGRARMVPIDTPRKRELLEKAKEIARGKARGVLSAKPGMSLRAALKHYYYYLAERVGLTKAKLGVTLHGLRHEFAGTCTHRSQARHEDIGDATGNPSRFDSPIKSILGSPWLMAVPAFPKASS